MVSVLGATDTSVTSLTNALVTVRDDVASLIIVAPV